MPITGEHVIRQGTGTDNNNYMEYGSISSNEITGRLIIIKPTNNKEATDGYVLGQQTIITTLSLMHLNAGTTQRAMEIKGFLEINYRFHYSHDALAKQFGINKFKLKKEFKAVTGYNIHEYVTRVRIENAKVYLENTNKTICDIAHKVGLDKSNFIKQFKNYTGSTPTEWRRNLNSESTFNQL